MEQYHRSENVVDLQKCLLNWFKDNKREMPWRTSVTPYGTLVSEIMLQQTQVSTVIPYFNRWMEKFPTIQHLANANEDDVLQMWKGLGYYSRATRLIKAAKMIVDEFDGEIPTTRQQILKIPGIGPYTAGAILSIAYDLQEPLIDGNVIRVLSRVFGILKRPESRINAKDCKTVDEYLWKIARDIVPKINPGFFNESLMELGSEVCTPKQPKCAECPIQSHCELRKFIRKRDLDKSNAFFKTKTISKQLSLHGDGTICELCDIEDVAILTIEDIPKPKPRLSAKIKENCVLYIVNEDMKILVEQRPKRGLLASLWQFPMVDSFGKEEAALFFDPLNCESKYLDTISHVFTHFKQILKIYKIKSSLEVENRFKGQWVAPSDLYGENSKFPLWTGMVKVMALCEK